MRHRTEHEEADEMTTLLHCADIHLSQKEKDYSLSVIDEIIEIALTHGVNALLFCGDTFDSFDDAVIMRQAFRERIRRLPQECEIFLLAGNHEYLRRGANESLAQYDFGIPKENIIEGGMWKLFQREGFEILAIPHQSDYRSYAEWDIPEKQQPVRIAMAHGVLSGLSFTGFDDEEDERAAVMDIDLFIRHSVDYAAFGHLHSIQHHQIGRVDVVYPGSARVWRTNESGPRHVVLVTCGATVTHQPIAVKAAGRFRTYRLFVNFSGDTPALPDDAEQWHPADWIALSFFGIVEDETTARENIQHLVNQVKSKIRRVETDVDDIKVLANISTQPLAKKFFDLWNEKKPVAADPAWPAWQRALELGLLKIMEIIKNTEKFEA